MSRGEFMIVYKRHHISQSLFFTKKKECHSNRAREHVVFADGCKQEAEVIGGAMDIKPKNSSLTIVMAKRDCIA